MNQNQDPLSPAGKTAVSSYVHGYSQREAERLLDQGRTLTELLHHDTRYPAGSRVLEAGCGVGAQTVTLAKQSPGAEFTGIDCSDASLAEAEKRVRAAGVTNGTFRKADIFNLPFETASFDHIFVCFVLEHLTDPAGALAALKRVLRHGGTITVIEGDHGSTFFHPDSPYARKAIDCLVLPSLWEGFGIVLIEAMAAGKPVITTHVSSMPEIVQHNESGLVVPVQDATALANAFATLLQNPRQATQWGENGRQRVLKMFTIDRMLDELVTLFSRTVQNKI